MSEIKELEFPLPLIHLNGNSRDRLLEYYTNALLALQEQALVHFNQIDFHPRDYYPLGDDAFSEAQAERLKVYESFKAIQDYLEKHIEHLSS